MASRLAIRRLAAAAAAAVLLFLGPAPVVAANPSLSADFGSMMDWLSQELAQGMAFNAGSTFDPPQEVKGWRLQPDVSVGAGSVPLDKTKFPVIETPALRDFDPVNIFPARVLFPNLTMHLRAGLPGRFDASIRAADATTPNNYKISPTAVGKAQSNSIGVGLRRHFFGGGEDPMVTIGLNYNHVLGGFSYKTKMALSNLYGFSANADVKGDLDWNVNSYGINAVISQAFGPFIPFIGAGYNYATGSVHSKLRAVWDTPAIAPSEGTSSRKPEPDSARAILGLEWNASRISLFANGEVKVMGDHSGDSWIVHVGIVMPFRIGPKGGAKKGGARTRPARRESEEFVPVEREPEKPRQPRKPAGKKKPKAAPPPELDSDLILIQ